LENKIIKYLEDLDKLKDKVDKSSESVLKNIDIDRMLDSIPSYLKAIAKAYYDSHSQEILEAINIGSKHGKKMLKE
tara:strand:- start:571 stop:798 length:228 start_codon:yes stop_codon:yes gene_type:complete